MGGTGRPTGSVGPVEVIRFPGRGPRPEGGTAVTIGAYDGVHLGHREVIRQVRERAAERRLRSAVVTFDRHPAMVVRPESAPLLLTDLDQKLELLAGTGVEYTVVVTFDGDRAAEPAEEFVEEVLVGCLHARAVVVGDDFHFGHERKGNVDLLRRIGEDRGFDVSGVALVGPDGTPAGEAGRVSSTAIRRALRAGELDRANAMLGRPHEVRGLVSPGDRRGRELGFPTANVAVPGDILLPADGIYAGWFVRLDGTTLPAAISLGRRPTFYEEAHASLLEAHVLDFDGDLYGEHVAVRFVGRLRGEERFESVDALVAQMVRDCDRARALLAG
ncbi:MAG: bifunctional riboflavin kinase/FAD synthetase [Actinobacteria bacterium]|nr:bifunctional riboflavin kinase/FAD synthetase [Actinomycetota bacterium]